MDTSNNPYNFIWPVTDPKMFFGRQELLQRLEDGLTAAPPRSLALYGGRRTGKTSLLRMLERKLKGRVAGGWQSVVVPVYLDLQGEQPSSPADFFQRVRHHLQKWQEVVVGQTELLPPVDGHNPAMSFAATFSQLYQRARPTLGSIRLALLIDESDRIQRAEWAHDLDDYLRFLLANHPVTRGHVGLILAGSVGLYIDMAAKQNGSPLRNVLNGEIILPPCPPAEMLRLINEPANGRFPKDVANEVIRQAGGHLFLGQFLLHGLWERNPENMSVAIVRELAAVFEIEKGRDFESWQQAIGDVGQRTYATLRQSSTPLTRRQLCASLKAEPLTIKRALDLLVFHNLVFMEEQPEESEGKRTYTWQGEMFRAWFGKNTDLSLIVEADSNEVGDLVALRQKLVKHFNGNELQDLCFDLGIEYGSLPGQSDYDKARELIGFCERHGRLSDLRRRCQQLRSHITW